MPRDTTASMTASQGLDDDALLARYAAGDRAAAQILLDRLAPRVLRLARRLLQDPSEAEDVTQAGTHGASAAATIVGRGRR